MLKSSVKLFIVGLMFLSLQSIRAQTNPELGYRDLGDQSSYSIGIGRENGVGKSTLKFLVIPVEVNCDENGSSCENSVDFGGEIELTTRILSNLRTGLSLGGRQDRLSDKGHDVILAPLLSVDVIDTNRLLIDLGGRYDLLGRDGLQIGGSIMLKRR